MRATGVFSRRSGRFLAALAASWALGGLASAQQSAANPAHMHIGHVMTSWTDTPGKVGFLPAAVADATIAALCLSVADDSVEARKRVPIIAPAAPRHITAARPAPS